MFGNSYKIMNINYKIKNAFYVTSLVVNNDAIIHFILTIILYYNFIFKQY